MVTFIMKYVCKVHKGRTIDIHKYYWSLEVMSVSLRMCYEWMTSSVYQFIRTYYSVSLKTLIMNKLNKPLYQYVMFFLFNYFTLIRCKYMYLDLNMVVSLCFFLLNTKFLFISLLKEIKNSQNLLLRPFSCETIKKF